VEKNKLIEKTQEKYPFLTGISYGGEEYIGIVVNHDNTILTFYNYDKLPDEQIKKIFLELGDMWWWESNRQLPIDVFLNHEMKIFHKYLSTFVMKDVEILFGPTTSLQNLLRKRIKRRGVQLVIKPSD
tara:strand:+ start:137 stop:520 length:384 start_codon:yes stop_codon:yes gene_type:complete